jgi:hypothetical protein
MSVYGAVDLLHRAILIRNGVMHHKVEYTKKFAYFPTLLNCGTLIWLKHYYRCEGFDVYGPRRPGARTIQVSQGQIKLTTEDATFRKLAEA